MPRSKVIFFGEELVNLENDTVDANHLAKGYTAHDKTGALITGLMEASAGGGLPSGIKVIDFGDVVINSAFTTTRQTFQHKLGVVPDLMIVYAPSNIATTYSMLAAIRGNVFGWRSSAYNNHYAYHGNSTTTVTWTNSNSTSYGISNMTATSFQLASSSSSYYWRAGTYKYIAIKFS